MAAAKKRTKAKRRTAGKLVKGSAAAKKHMAKLRALQKRRPAKKGSKQALKEWAQMMKDHDEFVLNN
jgi:hypothetical protein